MTGCIVILFHGHVHVYGLRKWLLLFVSPFLPYSVCIIHHRYSIDWLAQFNLTNMHKGGIKHHYFPFQFLHIFLFLLSAGELKSCQAMLCLALICYSLGLILYGFWMTRHVTYLRRYGAAGEGYAAMAVTITGGNYIYYMGQLVRLYIYTYRYIVYPFIDIYIQFMAVFIIVKMGTNQVQIHAHTSTTVKYRDQNSTFKKI